MLSAATSSLARRGLVYTGSATANGLINLLLLPVLTAYLTPADYGYIETFISIVALVVGLSMFGANTTINKVYFQLSTEQRGAYIGNAVVIIFVATILLLLVTSIALFVRPSISVVYGGWLLVGSAVIAAGLRAVFSLHQTVLQLEKQARIYAFFVNINSVGEIVFSLAFIVLLAMAWEGRILGALVMLALSVYSALGWLRRHALLRFRSTAFFRKIAANAAILILAHVAGWGLTMADRLILHQLLGPDQTGIYGVGARFASVITVAGTAFSLAWLPFFYQTVQENTVHGKARIVKATYFATALLLGGTVLYAAIGPAVLRLMVNERFYDADGFIMLLSLAYCAGGIWKLFTGYLIFHERLGAYSGITCASAALNILLDYVLISRWGAIGAAWAALIAMSVGMAATIGVGVKIHDMPWRIWRSPQNLPTV